MTPEITIAFLNYNTADELLQGLASVPAAAAGVNARVIVIDNGSSDNSLERIKSCEPIPEIIALPRNTGFAAAFNRLFSYTVTPYYLLLNSDIILPPGCVRAMLDTIAGIPDAGIAGMALMRENGTSQMSYYPLPTLASELTNRSLWQRIHRVEFTDESPGEVPCIIGAVMLVPRNTIDTVGMLDERFFFFMEETDWCKRIAEAGLKVLHFPGIRVTHLQGRSANVVPVQARIEFHRSRLIYFEKHYGRIAKYLLAAGSFIRLLVNWLAYLFLTLFCFGIHEKTRSKFMLYSGLLGWYLLGCPDRWGLR
jgi:GT2 family glycosyltransferase